jgi:hypothetical protein
MGSPTSLFGHLDLRKVREDESIRALFLIELGLELGLEAREELGEDELILFFVCISLGGEFLSIRSMCEVTNGTRCKIVFYYFCNSLVSRGILKKTSGQMLLC